MFSAKLISRLKHAYHISVLTGAGISAESGVPTFRGKDGIWNNYNVAQLATPEALKENAALFWEFYHWRRSLLANIKPNFGHYSLVDLEKYFNEFTLITQNVDNLHRLAGSENIIEIHGNISKTKCSNCSFVREESIRNYEGKGIIRCPKCDHLMRPDVVLFNENLSSKVFEKAQESAATSEVFFSIGTSALVEPAASLPYIAKGNGAYLVEINKEETPLTAHADESIRGESGKILPHLVTVLFDS